MVSPGIPYLNDDSAGAGMGMYQQQGGAQTSIQSQSQASPVMQQHQMGYGGYGMHQVHGTQLSSVLTGQGWLDLEFF